MEFECGPCVRGCPRPVMHVVLLHHRFVALPYLVPTTCLPRYIKYVGPHHTRGISGTVRTYAPGHESGKVGTRYLT